MYKIGDEVLLKKPDWFPENKVCIEQGTSGEETVCFIDLMLYAVGQQTRIKQVYFDKKDCYLLENIGNYWHENWLEPVNQVNVDEDTLTELLEV